MEFYEKNEPRPSHYRYYNEKRNTLQEEEDNEMAAGELIKVLVDVLVPLIIGYICRQKGWMGEKSCRFLMLVNVVVLLTTMNLLSFWILPIDFALILIPILSLVAVFLADRPGGGISLSYPCAGLDCLGPCRV